MAKKHQRRLCIEALDDRRVLNAGPISSNIQLVSVDSSTGAISTYENSQSQPFTINSHPEAVNDVLIPFLSGDFNNDAVTDLLARDSVDNSWWLQINDGSQLFEFPVAEGVGSNQILGARDFNQDNLLDVASINAANEITISINNGATFTHEVWGSFPAGMVLDQLFLGDFSGDGQVDILAGQNDGLWQLAVNQGTSFTIQSWGTFADFGWTEVLTGNFTGDQFQDVVALAPDLTWWLWEGSANGFAAADYFGHWKSATGWTDVRVGDFSDDGVDDLIARTPDGKLRVATAEPDRFNTWVWGSGWIDSANWTNVTVLDLNGDNVPDQLSQGRDGTWWYAINDGGSFSNYYWQRGANVDFVLTDFRVSPAQDVVDSLPADGIDLRTLIVTTQLDNDNLFQIEASGPIEIDGISFSSASGSLIAPFNGGAALPGADQFAVSYGEIQTRLQTGQTLQLDVGWNTSGTADLVVTIQLGDISYPVRVPASLGPAVTEPTIADEVANLFYFNALPSNVIRPGFAVTEEDNDNRNTISRDAADLEVSLSDTNRIVLETEQSLAIVGLELRSESGSLVPIGNGTLEVQVEPFLEILANSPNRIVLTSENWPVLLNDTSLVTDIGWLPNATAKDLIVTYRLEGQSGDIEAYIDEPLRLPFLDAALTSELGATRRTPAQDENSTELGTTRVLVEIDPDNPPFTHGATRIIFASSDDVTPVFSG